MCARLQGSAGLNLGVPKLLLPLAPNDDAAQGRDDRRAVGARACQRQGTDPRAARAARAGVRRGGRLHRPGQLRDEHRGRRQVRLPARVGDHRREPDGDARAVPVGEGRHRDRAEPAGAVSRAPAAADHLGAVGAGGDHRDRDRPGRVRRRGDRAQPAVRRAAVRRRADHRGGRVRRSSRSSSAATGASSSRSRASSASCASASSTTSRRCRSTPARSSAGSCRGSTAPTA